MNTPSLNLLSSAVLVWMPNGEQPDIQKFSASLNGNPEPWWLLHEAITYAATIERMHDKLPWIKTGEHLLSPDQIQFISERMGNLRNWSSDAHRT